MPTPFGVYVGIIVIVIIAALFLVSMKGRGRLIECPECGEKFKRPAFAQKQSGIGFSLPGLGDYECPKCRYRASTSAFRYVDGDKDKV